LFFETDRSLGRPPPQETLENQRGNIGKEKQTKTNQQKCRRDRDGISQSNSHDF
jgi:hypothetical protein